MNIKKLSISALTTLTILGGTVFTSLTASANVHHLKATPSHVKVLGYHANKKVVYHKKGNVKRAIRVYKTRSLKSYVVSKQSRVFTSKGALKVRFANHKLSQYVKVSGKVNGYVYVGQLTTNKSKGVAKKQAPKKHVAKKNTKKVAPKKHTTSNANAPKATHGYGDTMSAKHKYIANRNKGHVTSPKASSLPKANVIKGSKQEGNTVVTPWNETLSNTNYRGFKGMATLRDKMNAWGKAINEGKAGLTSQSTYISDMQYIQHALMGKKIQGDQAGINDTIKEANMFLSSDKNMKM